MKKLLLTIVAILSIALFTNCAKKTDEVKLNYTIKEINGLKVYANKNVPSVKDLKVELKEIFTIKGFEEDQPEERNIAMPMAVDVDKEGNIFILDRKTTSTKKFSENGEFIKSFGRQGSGPGEARFASALNIIGDTIVVVDMGGNKLTKFDLNGNHITDTSFGGNKTPVFFLPFNDKHSLGVIWYEGMEGSDFYVSVSLSIINNKFKEVKVLDTKKKKFVQDKFNIADLIGSYAISNNKLYINSPSENRFFVTAYDYDGNELYGISKNYRKLVMSKKEMKDFNEGMKKVFGLNLVAVEIPKRAINAMHFDKYGRLWTLTSVERDDTNQTTFYADLFKDGVYLNRVEIPQLTGSDYFDVERRLYFIGEYIYLLDMENNEIKVFDY